MDNKNQVHVIACGVLAIDIMRIAQELGVELSSTFLEGGLHNRPKLLRQKLQEAIDKVSARGGCDRIVIGYGLCGNGAVGIAARNVPLIIPRVHDCIALFLGSDEAYKRQFARYPGTYYISAGWYEGKVQPQGQKQDEGAFIADRIVTHGELVREFGEENATAIREFVNSWQKNYQRAAFIDTSAPGKSRYESYAKQMAQAYGWKYEAIQGDCALLRKALEAATTTDDILVVPPGHVTVYDARLGKISSAPPNRASADAGKATESILKGDGEGEKQEFSRLGLGIDAGGTYTDAAIYEFSSRQIIAKAKSLTTKWDYAVGIREVLKQLPREQLGRVDLAAVSTTLATNAIVEGHGSRVGLLLMPPYGVLNPEEIVHEPKAVLKGRLDITGRVLEAVDEAQVRAAVEEMVRQGATAFAVSGYAATINPEHELAVKRIVKELMGYSVTCGHELSDMLDFKTRATTAVLNARIIGRIETFLRQLKDTLWEHGVRAPIMVVRGDGTLMSERMAAARPVETVLSGPAASVAGARYLTGQTNAIVVDVGGTTTDTAAVREGMVRVHDSGTRVGGHRTHVKALDMRTIGLGGDSAINITGDQISIGPRRVEPVCRPASGEPGMEAALAYLESRLDRYRGRTEPMQLLTLSNPHPPQDLCPQERDILAALGERPFSIDELTEKLGLSWHTMLRTQRLEEHHVITRCGLTPTDLMHVSGRFVRWDAEGARRMCDLFAYLSGTDTPTFMERVRETITRRLTIEILKKKLDERTDPDALDHCGVCRTLLENLFQANGDGYRVSITLDCPVIGVGAPAGWFVPEAAARLGTTAIIHQHADVANAIGAISSDVLVRRTVRISVEEETFVTEGLPGAKRFTRLEQAHDYAVKEVARLVRQSAHEFGTSQTDVRIACSDTIVQAADGTEVFLGREIRAELSGRPDIKTGRTGEPESASARNPH